MSNEEEKFRFKIFLVKDEFIDSPYIKDESELDFFCVEIFHLDSKYMLKKLLFQYIYFLINK